MPSSEAHPQSMAGKSLAVYTGVYYACIIYRLQPNVSALPLLTSTCPQHLFHG